ncbi:HPr family phosphocarrier protein [Propionibacterium australiense]|uniref:HPr family phosphocarrier protein n=1 Tax=Propionibacterium australiense TaxID=119981 RepID=A0A383S6R7_9ACTN|nr:HPr family phosphocarrier protein [Propionibacterium australiense]RLP10038.1 HPr family phosphocarrier protein [Propionibacterium australiense]RLP11322.1 HPr family phosphocarrier protein [Propionibacterium australiense]SYZ32956.1 PTS HPr component phosphorylation site [Propionibacterium australiense]VEH92357.1 Phosphocarrier protein HPr [Propionibacterium australiense]
MISRTVTISDPLGLHARMAALLARAAEQFESSLWLSCRGKRASLTSQLKVLALGARRGDEVLVLADGLDETEALEAIAGRLALGTGPLDE